MVLVEAGIMLADKLTKTGRLNQQSKEKLNDEVQYVKNMLIDVMENSPNKLKVLQEEIKDAIHKEEGLEDKRKEYQKIKSETKKIENAINNLHQEDSEKFDELKKEVDLLVNFITSANTLVQHKTKTKEELREIIKRHKNNIIQILGINITLHQAVEEFLSKK